jgi:hypothetical protein
MMRIRRFFIYTSNLGHPQSIIRWALLFHTPTPPIKKLLLLLYASLHIVQEYQGKIDAFNYLKGNFLKKLSFFVNKVFSPRKQINSDICPLYPIINDIFPNSLSDIFVFSPVFQVQYIHIWYTNKKFNFSLFKKFNTLFTKKVEFFEKVGFLELMTQKSWTSISCKATKEKWKSTTVLLKQSAAHH